MMPNKPFPFGTPGEEKKSKQMQENILTAISSSWKEQTKHNARNIFPPNMGN